MSKKKRGHKTPQKKSKSSLIGMISLLLLLVCFAGYIVYNAISINIARQNVQNWFKVSYGKEWSAEELRAWDKLIYQSVPEIESHLGHPPFVISIRILKGKVLELSKETPTFGGKFDPQTKIQEIFCPSPIKSPSICLHEIIHHFYQGHIPKDLFFREGIAIYLQKLIGDKLGYNHNDDPSYPEYLYHLGDNYMTANQPEIAPYAAPDPSKNDIMSNLFPMYRIQYAIFGYFWKVLNSKDSGFLKKITAKLWLENGYKISSVRCLELAEECYPGFRQWYSQQKALVPNSFSGYRMMVFAWPQPEDLAILHWQTWLDPLKKGMYEQPFDMASINISVIHQGQLIYRTTTDMKGGQVVLPGFIQKLREKYPVPFNIIVETGGFPNLIKTLKIE